MTAAEDAEYAEVLEFVWTSNPSVSSASSAVLICELKSMCCNSNLKLQLQTVVGEAHVRGQCGIRGFVSQIVADVGEKGSLRFHPFHDSQRILHRGVRRMGLVAQRIQEKNIQPFQLMKRRFGNLAVIGEVCRLPKSKAVNLCLSVNQPHRLEARAEQLHRTIDRPQFQLRQAAVLIIRVENVCKHPSQKRGRIGTGIERQL